MRISDWSSDVCSSDLWATPNPDMAAASDSEYFRNPNFSFSRAAMDHIEHSVGNEWSFRGDTQYNFDDGSFLKHVKVGARYDNRAQKLRNSAYNWGSISQAWSGSVVIRWGERRVGQESGSPCSFGC